MVEADEQPWTEPTVAPMVVTQAVPVVGEHVLAGSTLFHLRPLPHRLARISLPHRQRSSYKLLRYRFPAPRLPVQPLVRQSLAARSMMTRAMAEGKSVLELLGHTPTSTYIPEVHFAGD